MPTIQLGYGHDSIGFEYDPARFEVLTTHRDSTPLSDPEIGAALDDPIESPPLEELIEPGDSVLIVASDATRATGSAQVVNLLVRRLIQNGIAPADIAIIFATGIHRAVRAHACADGGTIVLLAECADGLGRSDFVKWFEFANSGALELRLRKNYEVNGQTAWALMTKAENFRVHILTGLDEDRVRRMRMTPAISIESILAQLSLNATGYIMPRGAALLPRTET